MAAVMAPLAEVEEVVASIDGYVVLANVNSTHQVVLGGATDAVGRAVAALQERGHDAIPLPVSHAFHTEIVRRRQRPAARDAAAARRASRRSCRSSPTSTASSTRRRDVEEQMLDILARQVASPVQFVKGLHTLYDDGRADLRRGRSQARAAGLRVRRARRRQGAEPGHQPPEARRRRVLQQRAVRPVGRRASGAGVEPSRREDVALKPGADRARAVPAAQAPAPRARARGAGGRLGDELGRLFAEFVERGRALMGAAEHGRRARRPSRSSSPAPALGLPGAEQLFDDANVGRLLDGEQGIDVIPGAAAPRDGRQAHHAAGQGRRRQRALRDDRPRSTTSSSSPRAPARSTSARSSASTPTAIAALGRDTQLAIAAGIDALRDAGIPLVLRYQPDDARARSCPTAGRCPDALRDDTGVIFASAFPGLEEMADEVARHTEDRMRRERLAALESLRARMLDHERHGHGRARRGRAAHPRRAPPAREREPTRSTAASCSACSRWGTPSSPSYIGARGPEHAGQRGVREHDAGRRARRGLDPRGPLPAGRDRRRRRRDLGHDAGLARRRLPGLRGRGHRRGRRGRGAAVRPAPPRHDHRHGRRGARGRERRRRARARDHADLRGARLGHRQLARSTARGSTSSTSAASWRTSSRRPRRAACRATRSRRRRVFVSHETYTPARGGSAAAEIHALRQVFGADADSIVIANTKGFTGHPMGVGHRGRRSRSRRSRPASCRRCRTSATSTRSSGSSTSRTAAPTRSATRCASPPASARRSA